MPAEFYRGCGRSRVELEEIRRRRTAKKVLVSLLFDFQTTTHIYPRLALLCFLWDTQHAVLFSQSLCMSAFELRISLPVNPTTWEASSAEEWYKSYKKETATSFLSVLKTYVNPGSSSPPYQLNALSRLLILHGLMSVSWDMKRRDQTSLS